MAVGLVGQLFLSPSSEPGPPSPTQYKIRKVQIGIAMPPSTISSHLVPSSTVNLCPCCWHFQSSYALKHANKMAFLLLLFGLNFLQSGSFLNTMFCPFFFWAKAKPVDHFQPVHRASQVPSAVALCYNSVWVMVWASMNLIPHLLMTKIWVNFCECLHRKNAQWWNNWGKVTYSESRDSLNIESMLAHNLTLQVSANFLIIADLLGERKKKRHLGAF